MLRRVDRVQIAVNRLSDAEKTVSEIFSGEKLREDEVKVLRAKRSTMQAGTSLIELLEPSGKGAVSDHIEKWGGGLFAAGFSVREMLEAGKMLEQSRVEFEHENGQLFIEPSQTSGMRVVLSQHHERSPVGVIKWIYEVTNVVSNWRNTADRYRDIFGLNESKFVPITSKEYGYTGALTMFDAPARLDRIELSQILEPEKAMGRFHTRRGDSLYMFYVETDDVNAILQRLKARGSKFAGQVDVPGATGLFIHPSAFLGTLVGVSRSEHAWMWSGDPERARRAGATGTH